MVGKAEPLLEKRADALMRSLSRLLGSWPSSFADAEVPERPGIYVIFDGSGQPCYVGQSGNLRRRLLIDHRKGNGKANVFRRKLAHLKRLDSEPAITSYIVENCSLRFLEVDSEWERLEIEHFATAILAPVLNAPAGWYNGPISAREARQCSQSASSPASTSTAAAW
jgi:hypothetical protein